MLKELLKRLLSKPKYEYLQVDISKNRQFNSIDEELNKFGDEGWSLIAVLENTHVSFKALLQREI